MDTTIRAGTPLRQRMLDDMRMRKLEPKTQEAYVRAVRKLAAYLKVSPDTASVEDLRNFQLHLVDAGTSPITLNATHAAQVEVPVLKGAHGRSRRSGGSPEWILPGAPYRDRAGQSRKLILNESRLGIEVEEHASSREEVDSRQPVKWSSTHLDDRHDRRAKGLQPQQAEASSCRRTLAQRFFHAAGSLPLACRQVVQHRRAWVPSCRRSLVGACRWATVLLIEPTRGRYER